MPKGATHVLKALDLCIEMDEPMLLIDELRKVAEVKATTSGKGEEWDLIARATVELLSDLRAKNHPAEKAEKTRGD